MKPTLSALAVGTVALGGFFHAGSLDAGACTRVIYKGLDNLYIIGRSLDWKTPIPTNIYVYPRGIKKQSSDKPGFIQWTSKYGAVYAVSYDGGVTEGMNEMGLSINGLFCKGTVYDNAETMKRPPMSLAMFVAWLLDLNATTDEVVAVLKEHNFNLGGATFDDGTVSALHWGITDASGKTAYLEFDHGEVKIYEDDGDMNALTNDPDWPYMQAIVAYWQKIGGMHMLPGTVSSPDRCVRADYFITHVEKTGDAPLGTSITRTVLHCSCVPYTYTIQGEPNVSSTQWCSFSNLRDRLYHFELATGNGLYYIDLKKLLLTPGSPVLKLTTSEMTDVAGCANHYLKETVPFTPMY